MKEIFIQFLNNFWLLLNAIAFYILIGVMIAGVFKQFLPDKLIKKHLGQKDGLGGFMSSIKAALLGIPLPLCSCSVIPFVSALKKSGASPSAIQTFLISTPITGADSILATYGVFGWVFTLYRVISSVVISLLAGLFTLVFTDNRFEQATPVAKSPFGSIDIPIIIEGQKPDNRWYSKTKAVFAYALDDILKDIARALLFGVFLGALVVSFFPQDLSHYFSDSLLLNYLLVIALSVPLYVCATASIPLGLALISAGFSPGAAFIFLTAGPATNMVTISVVQKTLGKASLVIYLSSVIIGSLIFGIVLDSFFADAIKQITSLSHKEEALGFVSQVSSVILLYLIIKYTINPKAKVVESGGCGH